MGIEIYRVQWCLSGTLHRRSPCVMCLSFQALLVCQKGERVKCFTSDLLCGHLRCFCTELLLGNFAVLYN